MISPQSVSERRATRLYSRAARVVLALILLAYAMYLPTVGTALARLDESSQGRSALSAILLGTALAMLTLWGAAIWYARVSSEVVASRLLVVAVLALTNVVGAFFYYWCAVHWRSSTRVALRPGAPAQPTARAV